MTRLVSRRLSRIAPLLLVALLLGLGACARSPATGETFFTGGLSEEREKEIGAEEHPKMVAQFGGEYEDEDIQRYVTSIGELLAATSEWPDLGYTFTVLDSPIVNAFALPGGYVYVTRGLMTLATNEAELASVVGHEIGHVTGRHLAERYGSSVLANVGLLGLGILTGNRAAVQLGQTAAQLALASYSRGQENEADRLGVRYLARAGYEPEAMASFLSQLQRERALEAKRRGQEGEADSFHLLSTHPRTGDRVREAILVAGGERVADPMIARDIYLDKLNGMIYGDSPAQGFARGTSFRHPELKFAFDVPAGFHLTNLPSAVIASQPEGATIIFDLADPEEVTRRDLVDYLRYDWAKNVRLREVERITINGMPAATGRARLNTRKGRRDYRLIAVRYDDEHLYRFQFITPPDQTGNFNVAFRETTYSFRKLSAAEAEALAPWRLKVVAVRPGESVETMAQRMAVSELPEETFRVINGLGPDETIAAGERVKIVVEEAAY